MKPTAEQRVTVVRLASIGVSTEEIGHVIGKEGAPLDEKTIRRHFRTELDRGAALCGVRVKRKLHELIDQGNPAAIFFYLKCREGWREVQRIETTGADGAPLPAAVNAGPVFYLPAKDAAPAMAPVDMLALWSPPERAAQPGDVEDVPQRSDGPPASYPPAPPAEPADARAVGSVRPGRRFYPPGADPRR